MELQKFITETIKQITDALVESNDYILTKTGSSDGVCYGNKKINFDIALTTNEGERDKMGAGVFVAQIFNAGASSELNSATSNTSRIRFEIAINPKMKTQ